jgi:hypothetical protein
MFMFMFMCVFYFFLRTICSECDKRSEKKPNVCKINLKLTLRNNDFISIPQFTGGTELCLCLCLCVFFIFF